MTFEVSRVKREEERTRIGRLAVERGLLSARELELLLERARTGARRRGASGARLGELLVRERYLTAPLLRELLEEQRRRRAREPEPAPSPEPATTARIAQYLARLRAANGQELLLMTDRPPAVRAPDVLTPLPEAPLTEEQMGLFAGEVFDAGAREQAARGATPVRVQAWPAGRFRITLSCSEQGTSISFRPVGLEPAADGITCPVEVEPLADLRRGLVVVAGASAVYRSSVLAKLVDRINDRARRHVITIERTITYEHASRASLVAQREVGLHTASYERALRATLREDPDVLAIGEIQGADAIATALLSAETGHLVVCSLHATTPSQALRRLVDVQGTAQRALVRATLANTLQAVVVLHVVAGRDGGRQLVADVLPATAAITRMIREDRMHQIDTAAATQPGSVVRDGQLRRLFEEGRVTRLAAMECAADPSCVEGVTPKRRAGAEDNGNGNGNGGE